MKIHTFTVRVATPDDVELEAVRAVIQDGMTKKLCDVAYIFATDTSSGTVERVKDEFNSLNYRKWFQHAERVLDLA